MKSFWEDIKSLWNYILFRDMGNLGEGCLVSILVWGVIILFGILIISSLT